MAKINFRNCDLSHLCCRLFPRAVMWSFLRHGFQWKTSSTSQVVEETVDIQSSTTPHYMCHIRATLTPPQLPFTPTFVLLFCFFSYSARCTFWFFCEHHISSLRRLSEPRLRLSQRTLAQRNLDVCGPVMLKNVDKTWWPQRATDMEYLVATE